MTESLCATKTTPARAHKQHSAHSIFFTKNTLIKNNVVKNTNKLEPEAKYTIQNNPSVLVQLAIRGASAQRSKSQQFAPKSLCNVCNKYRYVTRVLRMSSANPASLLFLSIFSSSSEWISRSQSTAILIELMKYRHNRNRVEH